MSCVSGESCSRNALREIHGPSLEYGQQESKCPIPRLKESPTIIPEDTKIGCVKEGVLEKDWDKDVIVAPDWALVGGLQLRNVLGEVPARDP